MEGRAAKAVPTAELIDEVIKSDMNSLLINRSPRSPKTFGYQGSRRGSKPQLSTGFN